MAVIKIQLIQPGKGGAFIAVEMRDLTNGVKTNQRWRTADTVEKLNTEEREVQYLFRGRRQLHLHGPRVLRTDRHGYGDAGRRRGLSARRHDGHA